MRAGVGRLAAVQRLSRGLADGGGLVERKAPRAGSVRGPADGAGTRLSQVLGRGELRQDAAGARGQEIDQGRAVLGEHHVELGDELPQIVLAILYETRPQAGELAQALDLRVGHITLLRGTGAEQARDDMGVDVIGLGLAPDEVAVAPGLDRVQDEHPIASAHQGGLQVLPEVAGRLKADHALRRSRLPIPPGFGAGR